MVAELGADPPLSPAASLPLDTQAAHFTATEIPPPPPPARAGSLHPIMPAQAADAWQHSEQQLEAGAGDMALEIGLPPGSCSHSPALSLAASLKQQHDEADLPASGFVPLSEMGGSSGPPTAAVSLHEQQPSTASPGSSEEEPSSRPLGRPPSATGYESGDDMDVLSMQHCTNCTGTLWGHICMDCGHMPAHDSDIFHPTVASARALHRPRLQGDALTVICWDERMELHEEGGSSMHPERPDRIRAVMARLQASQLADRCRRLPAREATAEEVQACHIPELLEAVDVLSEQARLQGDAGLHFSPDTYVNQHTAMCAKLSAGACVDVAAAVVRGEARAGVAVVRPPGHHAESNTAMGFCFFNNAGIAARAAQAAGAERVLIVDWDVHHGNGTQHIFESDPSVLYMSLHRHDGGSFYPGTGAAHEVGEGEGAGYTVNVPWPCGGMRNADYMAAFNHLLLPIAYEYAPDLVIISAGFDAAEGDPIGGCHLTPECYAHMAAQLQLVAPTVALLEGGYNLLSTAKGTEAVVRVLLGERPPPLPAGDQAACEYSMAAVAQAMRIQSRYWPCMRGLVQQQFKVLAAAAARQEQLAAMKRQRQQQQAASAAGGGGGGGGQSLLRSASGLLGSGSGFSGGDEDDDDGLMSNEEEEEEGGNGSEEELRGGPAAHSHHHHHHRSHDRSPYHHHPDARHMEETEADTPHREYRDGSGWDSDADLATDEPVSQDGSDSEGGGGEQARRHASGAAAAGEEAAGEQDDAMILMGHHHAQTTPHSATGVAAHAHAGDDGSPLHLASPPQRMPSDTAPLSDSEGRSSGGTASDGSNQQQQQQRGAGLTSASLSPMAATGPASCAATPATEEALHAFPSPPHCHLEPPSAAQPHTSSDSRQARQAAAAAASAAADAAHWKRLAVRAVVLKRPAHPPHQRLSPVLVEEDALQLVVPRQQLQHGGGERAVPEHQLQP